MHLVLMMIKNKTVGMLLNQVKLKKQSLLLRRKRDNNSERR